MQKLLYKYFITFSFRFRQCNAWTRDLMRTHSMHKNEDNTKKMAAEQSSSSISIGNRHHVTTVASLGVKCYFYSFSELCISMYISSCFGTMPLYGILCCAIHLEARHRKLTSLNSYRRNSTWINAKREKMCGKKFIKLEIEFWIHVLDCGCWEPTV